MVKAVVVDSLRVAYRPIEELIPYAMNARTHSAAQVAQIAGSIRAFGFVNPVLIDGEGTIVAGHGRVLAARQLGIEKVPTIKLPHLEPAQIRALVLTDNKLALNAGWDKELLASELEGLDVALRGLTGFAVEEIDKLLGIEDAPDEFSELGDDIETQHECPKCGYRWSGQAGIPAPEQASTGKGKGRGKGKKAGAAAG